MKHAKVEFSQAENKTLNFPVTAPVCQFVSWNAWVGPSTWYVHYTGI